MLRLVLIAFLTMWLSAIAGAQVSKDPAFNSYRVRIEKVRAKSINFRNNAGARSFRTRLSEALADGVNFAGHYVIAGWGCGTGCISGAIIDAHTGVVYWPLPLNALGVWYDGDKYADDPVAYRKNSRLLVISGSPGVKDDEPEKPNGKYYYEWLRNQLRLVKFVPFKSQ